jgi:hypothetical protein
MIKVHGVQKLLTYLLPRMGEILLVAVFLSVIGLGPGLLNADGDLGRHLVLGNYILDNFHVPTRDLFSFTKFGDPLTPHEWLAEVLFALAARLAGLDGVVVLSALVISLSIWVVYRNSLEQSAMILTSLLGGMLAAAASSLHWLARPHIFTILFSAIWAWQLERLRIGKMNNWVVFPILMLFWVNLHGAFLSGFAAWICYFIGAFLPRQQGQEQKKALLWAGASSLAVTLLNPDGIGIWKTGIGFLGNSYLVSHTVEYLPPDFQNASTWPFLVLILLSITILALSNKPLKMAHIFLIGGWTAVALYSARNIPLYAVMVVPVICGSLAGIVESCSDHPVIASFISLEAKLKTAELPLKGGLFSTLAVLLVFFLLYGGLNLDFQQQGNEFNPQVFPVQAANWMEAQPLEGDGFNYFPWGGYLLYRFWPEKLVFVDGQTDFYGEALTREYEAVITLSENWQEIMDKYHVRWVIMPSDSQLVQALDFSADWEMVYVDSTAVIYQLRGWDVR